MTTPARIRLEATEQWPTALIEHDGRWLTLHSRRDPMAEALSALTAVREGAGMVVFIGLGLGYVLDALERRDFGGRVLAVELDPELDRVRTARREWSAWDHRLTVVQVDALDGNLWRAFGEATEEPPVIVHPVLARTHTDPVRRAQAAVARAWFDHSANQAARKANAGRYLLNTLRNFPALSSEGDVSALDDRFAGVPAVVVGAGPSLDATVDEIAGCQARALIIAVDTAARPLLAAGVAPDLVVAVDPTETNARHLCDLGPCQHTWLVTEASIDPAAVAPFRGRVFFARLGNHHPWPWLRSQGVERGLLRSWGSVLTTAFDLALRMGCSPIVFAGADLAFTSGRPYARGTTFEEDWKRECVWGNPIERVWAAALAQRTLVAEPDVNGTLTQTAPHLRAFRDWIVEAARGARGTVVNASGHGILHGPGLLQSTLPTLAQSWPVLDSSVRARLRDAQVRVAEQATSIASVPLAEWLAAAPDLTEAVCLEALKMPNPSPPLVSPVNVGWLQALPAAIRPVVEALSVDDQARLRERIGPAERDSWRVVVSGDPRADLLARLRQAAEELPTDGTIIVVDTHGIASSAQLRRGVEALLCEQPAASLQYYRFVDHTSRLAIVELNGVSKAGGGAPDTAKHDSADRDNANRLMPFILSYLNPHTLIDLGCGAGHWVDAARRAGLSRAEGVAGFDAVAPGRVLERFDVCLCIEVAQALSASDQDALIVAATGASDTIVFSSMPPGIPGHPPHARPLPYWAEKFWRQGYALDEGLRQRVEQTFGLANAAADLLIVFRRVLPPQEVSAPGGTASILWPLMHAHAVRIHDLFMQTVWWQVELGKLRDAIPPGLARAPMRRFILPAHRLEAVGDGRRVFRFRSDAARWWLSHPRAALAVYEDERQLVRRQTMAALDQSDDGGYVASMDQITIASGDGRDPRHSGCRYSVALPPHVASAEERPLGESLRESW